MPPAARFGDSTSVGGTMLGPGEPTVLIGGMPAAVLGDNTVCPGSPPIPGAFTLGSTTVLIGGVPAIRVGDTSTCGAAPIVGEPTVMIG